MYCVPKIIVVSSYSSKLFLFLFFLQYVVKLRQQRFLLCDFTSSGMDKTIGCHWHVTNSGASKAVTGPSVVSFNSRETEGAF